MNIAIFTDCYLPIKNGVVTSVLQLKNGLEKRGHKVVIITSEVPMYQDKDDNIIRLPSIKAGMGTEQRLALFTQPSVNRFLKKKEIQLIHTHTEFSVGYSGKWAAKKLKIPHVHTTHTMWEEYNHYIMNGKLLSANMIRKILKAFLKKATALIAPSIKAKKYFHQLLPDIPIQIIHNGIDMHKFKSAEITKSEINLLHKEFDIKKNDKLIIFVGRIGREKRVVELLNAVVPIIKKIPQVKLLMVGDGPDLKELKKKAISFNIEKNIIFTGFVNWELVHKLYSISHIFATASLSEVHPMTLIEACICNLPIVARRDDSYLDLVQNGRNGYLVDADVDLTTRLIELLTNEEKRKNYAKYSYYISQLYTAENHVDKVESFYKKILELYPDKIQLLKD
jgi:1,2-diacylglycerol 3-alpha-glucosyltransferase